MGSPIPPAGMLAGEAPKLIAQVQLGIGVSRLVALGGAVLTHDGARPPLRQLEPLLQHVHESASPRRAHQFPLAISRSARLSSSLSATTWLSSRFSRSNSRSRLASSAFMPPN
jgi:hypothetical protein